MKTNIHSKIFPDFQSFEKTLNKWKSKNETLVFTNGCFDIIHHGHVDSLIKSAELGTKLIVGLNSDESVQLLKGENRPIMDEHARATVLAAFSFVDAVIVFPEETPAELIAKIIPNILVKGKQYEIHEIAGHDIVLNNGGKVITLELIPGISTSDLIHKIKNSAINTEEKIRKNKFMSATKTIYTCQNCGFQSPKWIGKCTSCGEWNTMVEEIIEKKKTTGNVAIRHLENQPITLENIQAAKTQRIVAGIHEFDRVLGGGIVPGSLILLGGDPGIGKSTLALQLALKLNGLKILYTSGEESLQQIKLRAERLKISNNNCLFLSETSLENLLIHSEQIQPDVIIIDSIQTISTETIESSPGSVSQVRECTSAILKFAKKSGVAVILIGHINKEGSIAGPKVLEHIVDTVLQFEGDTNYMYRILRSNKNRFGSTNELGIFEMRSDGLREITNPSEQLISKVSDDVSGTAIAATIEGIRPILIEIQALVSTAAYGTPQRSSTGFDLRRLNMLLAVLEKRAGFKLIQKDVFLNIAGGLKINDPATDLAVICSILSSNIDIPVDHKICFAGEVGLTGEIRGVNRIEQRIAEAAKLGFKKIIIPKLNKGFDASKFNIEIVKTSRVEEAFRTIFG